MRTVCTLLASVLCIAGAYAQELSPIEVSSFNRLKASGHIHVLLVPSEEQKLEIISTDHSEEYQVDFEGQTLGLTYKSEISKVPRLEVKLHYKTLVGINISKGVVVQSSDTLRGETLELDVLSGAKAELKIRMDQLDARVNQGADIILYGRAGIQHVDAFSWGNYLAYDLYTIETHVKAATGAQVKVSAEKVLEANATSKAFVGYSGEPASKSFKTSVGGEITARIP